MSRTYRKDLTGKRFGKLTVLSFIENDKPNSYWICRCDCGRKTIVSACNLSTGHTKSCGCFNIESIKAINASNAKQHRQSGTRLYKIWASMKDRCYNTKSQHYKNYGGRGITICDEWKNNFEKFYAWAIANGYDETLTIDRIDVNGNYEPTNCRWADDKTQARNRTNNVFIEYNGRKICLAEAAEITGINEGTLRDRYRANKRGKDLFKKPMPYTLMVEYKGQNMSLKEVAEISGINYRTLQTRYYAGKRGEELFKKVNK